MATGILPCRACTPGIGGGAGGSKEGRPRVASGTCTSGEREVPRRSPGSRSVEPDKGIVWCPSETKITVSGRRSPRGRMLPM